MLSRGRTAFRGATRALGPHLRALGHPLPARFNPAEFVLNLINPDFHDDPAAVERVLDAFFALQAPRSRR